MNEQSEPKVFDRAAILRRLEELEERVKSLETLGSSLVARINEPLRKKSEEQDGA